MKNIKTALAGWIPGILLILDALGEAYKSGTFDGKHGMQLIIAVAFIVLGTVAKDHNVTGGTIQQCLVGLLMLCSVFVNAQNNVQAKTIYSYNVSDTAFAQATRTNLQTLYGNTGGLYFDKTRNKFRIWYGVCPDTSFHNGCWRDISSGNGTVTSVSIAPGTNITQSGSPIIGAGSITVNAIPSGGNQQIQYNNSGIFAGSSNFTWNNSGQILNIGNSTSTGLSILNDQITHNNPSTNFGIGIADNPSGSGGQMTIASGNSTGSNGNGGDLVINSGFKNGSGSEGRLFINNLSSGALQLGNTTTPSILFKSGTGTNLLLNGAGGATQMLLRNATISPTESVSFDTHSITWGRLFSGAPGATVTLQASNGLSGQPDAQGYNILSGTPFTNGNGGNVNIFASAGNGTGIPGTVQISAPAGGTGVGGAAINISAGKTMSLNTSNGDMNLSTDAIHAINVNGSSGGTVNVGNSNGSVNINTVGTGITSIGNSSSLTIDPSAGFTLISSPGVTSTISDNSQTTGLIINDNFTSLSSSLSGGLFSIDNVSSGAHLTTSSINASYTIGSVDGSIPQQLTNSATLDFPNTNSGSSSRLTITVTGASTGDTVALGSPITVAAFALGTSLTAWTSATNTVTVSFNNFSGGALDPPSGSFKVTVLR